MRRNRIVVRLRRTNILSVQARVEAGLPAETKTIIMQRVRAGDFQFVYLSPERLTKYNPPPFGPSVDVGVDVAAKRAKLFPNAAAAGPKPPPPPHPAYGGVNGSVQQMEEQQAIEGRMLCEEQAAEGKLDLGKEVFVAFMAWYW